MSNYPSGYNDTPTMEELINEGASDAFQFVLDKRIKFRHEGDKNTELWWTPDSKHSGKCIASLVGFMNTSISDQLRKEEPEPEPPVMTPYGNLNRDDEDWFFSAND